MTRILIYILLILILIVASIGCCEPREVHYHYIGDTHIYVAPKPPASQPATRPSIFDRRGEKKAV